MRTKYESSYIFKKYKYMAILLIQITVIEKKNLRFNKNVYHCFDFMNCLIMVLNKKNVV